MPAVGLVTEESDLEEDEEDERHLAELTERISPCCSLASKPLFANFEEVAGSLVRKTPSVPVDRKGLLRKMLRKFEKQEGTRSGESASSTLLFPMLCVDWPLRVISQTDGSLCATSAHSVASQSAVEN
ncbi:unnamed protein product [Dibothriocephalus latus]|uniref:Uncharacterized protein n=1 Tax=Dibothriocephalus latus TaxID=60516 RepID=A0A3P6T0U6_DIBLA|nr:unnamed protein product [Dibothriocephalus latus]